MPLKCIIIEDDPVARQFLRTCVESFTDVEVASVSESAEASLPLIIRHEPDFLLLDVELPGMSGFEMLGVLRNPLPTILTTSIAEHAVRAFEFNVIDFIVKPVDRPRLALGLQKVRDLLNYRSMKRGIKNHIFVKVENQYLRVNIEDIRWVESTRESVRFQLADKSLNVSLRLKSLEESLAGTPVIRVHRSYFVNINYVNVFDNQVLVVNDKVIPVSKQYLPIVTKLLNLV